MKENPLKKVETFGQSIWLDYIRRDLITSGELQRLIDYDGLRGITSNPAIFEKAIAESNIYDQQIHDLKLKKKSSTEIYELISQQDVLNAADEFRNVYDKTIGQDGYVSLEVNPHLAYDTQATIEEANRIMLSLPELGIDMDKMTQQLEDEGVNKFITPFDMLMEAITKKSSA